MIWHLQLTHCAVDGFLRQLKFLSIIVKSLDGSCPKWKFSTSENTPFTDREIYVYEMGPEIFDGKRVLQKQPNPLKTDTNILFVFKSCCNQIEISFLILYQKILEGNPRTTKTPQHTDRLENYLRNTKKVFFSSFLKYFFFRIFFYASCLRELPKVKQTFQKNSYSQAKEPFPLQMAIQFVSISRSVFNVREIIFSLLTNWILQNNCYLKIPNVVRWLHRRAAFEPYHICSHT